MNETDSSLLQEAAQHSPSSPPRPTQYSTSPMEDDGPKSEPAAPQQLEQTPNRPRHKRIRSDETERPASAQHNEHEDHEDVEEGEEEEQNVLDPNEADPSAQIADFDWASLHERYHDTIKKCSQDEEELMQEWASLMEYFRVWASSGHEHETDRTFRRLQTRTMYVQTEEDELENTRNHYVNVVRAFESALNLLKQSTMFRG